MAKKNCQLLHRFHILNISWIVMAKKNHQLLAQVLYFEHFLDCNSKTEPPVACTMHRFHILNISWIVTAKKNHQLLAQVSYFEHFLDCNSKKELPVAAQVSYFKHFLDCNSKKEPPVLFLVHLSHRLKVSFCRGKIVCRFV